MIELAAIGPVVFVPEPGIVGVHLEQPPWDDVDHWPHVIWEQDDYLCVLRPELVRPL